MPGRMHALLTSHACKGSKIALKMLMFQRKRPEATAVGLYSAYANSLRTYIVTDIYIYNIATTRIYLTVVFSNFIFVYLPSASASAIIFLSSSSVGR